MKIAIIHLSDIHIQDKQNIILSRSKEIAKLIISETFGLKQIFIVITGDIAFSGLIEEYHLANTFFKSILDNIKPESESTISIIPVPGNHDCDFSGSQSVRNSLIDNIISDHDVPNEIIQNCKNVQINFSSFFNEIIQLENVSELSELVKIISTDFCNTQIQFLLINSSWNSRLDEKLGSLTVPENQLVGPEDCKNENEIVISLIHHPFRWFEFNSGNIIKSFLENNSDLILTGHEHLDDHYKVTNRLGSELNYISGGILHSTNDSTSSFNLIKIDFNEKQIITKTANWNSEDDCYECGNEQKQVFNRNQNRKNIQKCLQTNFELKLLDIGINFSHPRAEKISLQDVFIYPNLKKIDFTEKGDFDKNVIHENILDFIIDNPYIVIFGSDKSGKTALSKSLFKDFFNFEQYPLLIDGETIKDYNIDRMKSQLKKLIEKVYKKPSANKYFQLDKKLRVIIIDDFQNSKLNNKGKSEYINNLKSMFDIIILISNEHFKLEELLSDTYNGDVFNGFFICEIMGMNHFQRYSLIKKWNEIGNKIYQYEEEKLSKKLIRDEKEISALLGQNFVPPFPFFILILLQQKESGVPINTSSGSYGYLYERLLANDLSKISSSDQVIDIIYSYCTELAHYLFSSKLSYITETELTTWHNNYCLQYHLTLDMGKMISNLKKVSIFQKDNFGIKFKYDYIYYYFVGRYLRDNLHKDEIKEIIIKMSERLHQPKSAHIIMFLCHLSKDPFILETLISKSRNLFSKYSEFNMGTDPEKFSDSFYELPEIVLKIGDTEENQKKVFVDKDIEEAESNNNNDKDFDETVDITSKSDMDIDEFLQINVAFKNIQILGQLLKNFPGSWNGKQKTSLVQESYSLSLRVLQYIFQIIDENKEKVIQRMSSIIRNQHPKWDDSKINKNLFDSIINLFENSTYTIISHIVESIGYPELGITLATVLKNNPSNISYDFLDLGVKLDYGKEFPKQEISSIDKKVGLKNFSCFVLRHMVWYYFYIYKVDYKLRDSICKKLGIPISSSLKLPNKK